MDLSPANLLAGFVFGVFGFHILRWGKRDANIRRIAIGITLLAYSYFLSNPWAVWGVGSVLTIWAYLG